MRPSRGRMRQRQKIGALVSHAHIISARGIIGTERIPNHSVIWSVASRTVATRVVGKSTGSGETAADMSSRDPLNLPLITLTNNDCNQSALRSHYHHRHACPCNLPHRDAPESGDADATRQPSLPRSEERRPADSICCLGDKNQGVFAGFWSVLAVRPPRPSASSRVQ